MRAFFTSDTHFFHANILKYCARPFATVEDMNEQMIHAWNGTVLPDDEVFFLGDFGFGPPEPLTKIVLRLNGRKHLVAGNHDRKLSHAGFVSVHKLHEFKIRQEGVRATVVMCHFPMTVWEGSHHGTWNLHGHSHNTLKPTGRQLDVGVDSAAEKLGSYRPFSVADIASYMAKRDASTPDHHGRHTS